MTTFTKPAENTTTYTKPTASDFVSGSEAKFGTGKFKVAKFGQGNPVFTVYTKPSENATTYTKPTES